MLILPMALPEAQFDKMIRAMITITLFWAVYIAEVVRAGLQAIPSGQRRWPPCRVSVTGARCISSFCPRQALRTVIPDVVNLAIGFLLGTSLLEVIGVFDLLNAARAVATHPGWLGLYNEA